MLRSMTGYGRGEAEAEGLRYTLQLKSVNNRFLELALKLPSAFWAHEAEARAAVQKALPRGKVELSWREERLGAAASGVRVNLELAAEVRTALEKLAHGLGLSADVRLDQVARWPEVITSGAEMDEAEASKRWSVFKAALDQALSGMQASREREGAALESEIRGILKRCAGLAGEVETRSQALQGAFHEKLKKRLEALLDSLPKDDPRLVMEAALLSDKADIREELVRFRSHLAEVERLLGLNEPLGKKLDFLSQELLREVNTMGSKSPDASLAQTVVGLKSEIEKLKEQILNLE